MKASILTLLILTAAGWRVASEPELKKVIPARAPVIKENIETEFRTASGVTDGRGKFIAGVVMITAGYSAEGKYSHFFIAQVPVQIADFSLSRVSMSLVISVRRPTALRRRFIAPRVATAWGKLKRFAIARARWFGRC